VEGALAEVYKSFTSSHLILHLSKLRSWIIWSYLSSYIYYFDRVRSPVYQNLDIIVSVKVFLKYRR